MPDDRLRAMTSSTSLADPEVLRSEELVKSPALPLTMEWSSDPSRFESTSTSSGADVEKARIGIAAQHRSVARKGTRFRKATPFGGTGCRFG